MKEIKDTDVANVEDNKYPAWSQCPFCKRYHERGTTKCSEHTEPLSHTGDNYE